MIVAERKPFKDIVEMVHGYSKLLLLGCGSCVTVCMAGGEKEVAVLASLLRLSNKKLGQNVQIEEATIERQCDKEFFATVTDKIIWADAVLSLACGVGVQWCAELFPTKIVMPALNTKFFGVNETVGIYSERCLGCGQCIVHKFGGICPVAMCSKSLMNGPCGGSQNGMCEVDPKNIQCGWQLIYDKMKALGRLDELEQIEPIRDWRSAHFGGPRKIVKDIIRS